MPLLEFQSQLEKDMKKSVKLVINDNRSTMVSVKWEPECTKVSLHRFFLDAPLNIMDALASYIKKKERTISPRVKSFIEENLREMDYSHKVKKMKLEVEGRAYHLQHLYDAINGLYFSNKLELSITWFGKRVQRNSSQITFGLYQVPLKLIKINRLLDSPKVPDYFISYVIYHEMLHHVCPSYYDEKGRHRIHNKEFLMMEKQYAHYERAQEWINSNRHRLFSRSLIF